MPPGSPSLVTDDQYLASTYEPLLMFDSSEKWRPLNVGMFLSERDPSTGHPWNQICSPSQGSKGLTSEADLEQHPTSDSYIRINNSEGEPDTYRSPNPECTHSVGSTAVYDCGTGRASAIYYHVVGPSPGGYTYIDYWLFYPYNQGWNDFGNHAGDREGVTVAPSHDGKTFEFANSHNSTWNSFLRDNLDCDASGSGSCGTESLDCPYPPSRNYFGQHVMTFPAAGSRVTRSHSPVFVTQDLRCQNSDSGLDSGAAFIEMGRRRRRRLLLLFSCGETAASCLQTAWWRVSGWSSAEPFVSSPARPLSNPGIPGGTLFPRRARASWTGVSARIAKPSASEANVP